MSEQICKYIRSENQFDEIKLTLQDAAVLSDFFYMFSMSSTVQIEIFRMW